MQASDVMTTPVVTVAPDSTVAEAAKLMLDRRISGLPVLGPDGSLVGILSEGDLLRRVESHTEQRRSSWLELLQSNAALAAEYIKSHARTVKDVMTRDVVTVTEATPLREIAAVLEKRRIKRVPVVRGGKVVGIVARSNLLQALASAPAAPVGHVDDGIIRDRLIAELKAMKWADVGTSNVVVTNGIVHLWGVVLSDDERQATRVAAENIPGTKAVEDHRGMMPIGSI